MFPLRSLASNVIRLNNIVIPSEARILVSVFLTPDSELGTGYWVLGTGNFFRS